MKHMLTNVRYRIRTLTSMWIAPYTKYMTGAEPMLKYAPKARKRPVPIAKRDAKPVDIRDTYRDTMKRFPKTMALLAE